MIDPILLAVSLPQGPVLNKLYLYFRADSLTTDAISIAIATKENLYAQRSSLGGISGKMGTIAKKLPLIGGLMNKINLRSRRDSIIIGGVITGCLILMFMFS